MRLLVVKFSGLRGALATSRRRVLAVHTHI